MICLEMTGSRAFSLSVYFTVIHEKGWLGDSHRKRREGEGECIAPWWLFV